MKRGIGNVIQTVDSALSPHHHKNGEARRASRVGALGHLLVPAWAREEATENDAKIFGITQSICHIVHRHWRYSSSRSANDDCSMKPEWKVRGEEPEPLICHRAVGSRTIDTGKILGALLVLASIVIPINDIGDLWKSYSPVSGMVQRQTPCSSESPNG